MKYVAIILLFLLFPVWIAAFLFRFIEGAWLIGYKFAEEVIDETF